MIPLYGHDPAVAFFRDSLDRGRLHHAWLITGVQGIGKATFAAKAGLRVLAGGQGAIDAPGLDVPDVHPAAKLMAAGSHPDLMVLERLAKDSSATGELARSISVDQVRGLQRLFSTTASLSPWRVVIIDSIDDLERNAANALLKNLEEPPSHSLFLLVSHAPERLLPTIRSRCRLLRLSPLETDAMAAALRSAVPDADDAEIADLVTAGQGSPGRAMAFRGLDIAGLDRAMETITREGDPTNARRVALAQSLALKSAQPRYEAFLARAPSLIAAIARSRRGAALAESIRLWERAQSLASSARGLSLEPESVVFELSGMLAALADDTSPRFARG
ncbi:DNA polymerase III subunit delta' [Sphingosinicella sp. BN140058]|uniref:DNA polymerase III subunit delta' n=1 Tax=Sphingosinicella sp. BN140058 TaxID=1892855 RepID=UPI001012A7B6|nr:DNA polymerase III subunit delta' [Sphingosinicella sp. BN140058]QAY79338.1 DNA polymerase III subunit delta' [Sphingosinicella sp. BN140058]